MREINEELQIVVPEQDTLRASSLNIEQKLAYIILEKVISEKYGVFNLK